MSIVWVAALSGVVFLGGAHALIWLVLRAHQKAESEQEASRMPPPKETPPGGRLH